MFAEREWVQLKYTGGEVAGVERDRNSRPKSEESCRKVMRLREAREGNKMLT